MTDPYVTMLTALSSAFLGGGVALLGVFLTNRSNTDRLRIQLEHESQQKKADLLRSRGEELYELSEKWLNMFAAYYLRRSFVMQGKLTYNQCLDMDIEEGNKASGNFVRIVMLVDVYFPATRTAHEEITKAREELNKIEITFKRAYESGDTDGGQFLAPYVRCQKTIEQAGENFKLLVLENIRAL